MRALVSCVLALQIATQCACSGAARRGPELTRLDQLLSGPVARQVQHDAPDAYAEVARAAVEIERTAASSGEPLSDRVDEIEILLAWAATQARGARARARTTDADRRRAAAEIETARAAQQAARLEHQAAERITAQQGLVRARTVSAGAVAGIVPAARLQTAHEIRQQAELAVAAAALLGAGETALAPANAEIRAAELSAHGNDATAALVAAGHAFAVAEALVRQVRATSAPSQQPTDPGELVGQLSSAGGFEPRRDARGVIATMRGLFPGRGANLSPAARSRVETAARVIRSHDGARVRVEAYVGGADRASAERAARAQAQTLVQALERAGVPPGRMEPAGVYRLPGGNRSEDVVELVLLLPGDG